ncbi:MAG TPA: glutamate racemase [bacterium]|nr:glutamate racemase [bacterium]HOL48293.1 glutamate racemase [bacterium]HPQ19380.1 glutamate racemase [bacterium]
MKNSEKPIGIFDSGLGGLTVAKAINDLLPAENLIYFGDTARLPYGTKSPETVKKFSLEITEFLVSKNIKMLVIACNTSSSYALDIISETVKIPVIGVILPGVIKAIRMTKNNNIGVIGTTATINSNVYSNLIRKYKSDCKVFSIACPLFVPLIEEGWINKKVTNEIIKEYLSPLKEAKIDTLILGCTHYPLLKNKINLFFNKRVRIIDSAKSTAEFVRKVLIEKKIINKENKKATLNFYVSDLPYKFSELGSQFFKKDISAVRVDL